MKLIITGTPGCGKTTLAKNLSKKLKLILINEKDFALKNSLGSFNDENELEIPLKEFEHKANEYLEKNENVVFEGHVLCEMKLKVDNVILIEIDPEELESRLEQRNYSMEKVMDNVFCEGISYCKKKVQKNYPSKKVKIIKSQSTEMLTLAKTLVLLQ